MGESLTVDAWLQSADDRGASPGAIESHCRATPPDVQGAILRDCDGVLVICVVDGALPPAAGEKIYFVMGRGLYVESRRSEWCYHDKPRALLSLTALGLPTRAPLRSTRTCSRTSRQEEAGDDAQGEASERSGRAS